MKTTIITFILLSITIALHSCDDMVEARVPENQLEKWTVFENSQTAYAALSGLYADLQRNSPLAGNKTGPFLGTYTDDLVSYSQNTANATYDLYANQHIAANTNIYTIWSSAWQQIYLANSIIEAVERSASLENEDRDTITGEAMFARSLLYLYLVQLYGDIPYITSTDYMVNQSATKKSTTEILALIRIDAEKTSTLLKEEYRNTDRIYPNRKTTELILAKVAILQKRWQDAEILLHKVIDSPLYKIESDVKKVFVKSGKHILWQVKPQKEGDPTLEASTYYFNNAAPTTYSLSNDLINQFSSSDLRKVNWITPVIYNGTTWYRSSKYKNLSANNDEYSIVFRIEEAYLLMAEVLIYQGRMQESITFLNKTRQRAGLLGLSGNYSAVDLLQEVALEERREFFVEQGHRFFDLKKMGLLNTLIITKPNWKAYHHLWPIPQRDLLLNQNLNPQNVGY